MKINIVGIVKSSTRIVGYMLLDLDDNNKTMLVYRDKLIDIMERRKIRIVNAKLVRGKIQGRYYSLSSLSYMDDKGVITDEGILILGYRDGEYTGVTWNNAGVSVDRYQVNLMDTMIRRGMIINADREAMRVNIPMSHQKSGENENEVLNDLDRDALDENKVWGIEEFDAFMKSHNWVYRMTRTLNNEYMIDNIDPRCDVIHLPMRTLEVNDLYSSRPINKIKVLIINGDIGEIKEIYDGYSNRGEPVVIGRVVIQRDNRDRRIIDLGGLKNLKVEGLLKVEVCVDKLLDAFNNCNIGELYINSGRTVIDKSFNNSIFNNNILLVNAKWVEQSFNIIKGIDTLVFGKDIERIERSFNDAREIGEIDISRGNKLEFLGGFRGVSIEEIDLSRNIKLSKVNGFTSMPKLRRVILPRDGDTKLDLIQAYNYNDEEGLFESDVLDEIVISSKVSRIEHPIGGINTRIVFDKDIETVYATYYNSYTIPNSQNGRKNRIEYLSNNLSIASNFYTLVLRIGTNNLFKLGIRGEQVKRFMDYCLSKYDSEVFDSAEFPNVDTLPSELLQDSSKLTTLIIDNNIKSIGSNIVHNCEKLRNIVIGGVGDINPSAFAYIRNTGVIRVYAVKGTPGYKLFKSKSRTNFMLIEVNTVAEARELVSGKKYTSQKMIDRFRSLLGADDDYTELFKDKYIGSIQFIYKLCDEIKGNKGISGPAADTSNYRELKAIDLIRDTYNEIKQGEQIIRNDNVFNALNNLIVNFTKRDDRLYNYNLLSKYESGVLDSVIYVDDSRMIAAYKLKFKTNTDIDVPIVVIVIDGIIQYISLCSKESFLDKCGSNFKNNASIFLGKRDRYVLGIRNNNHISIGQYLQCGDVIQLKEDHIISGAYIPYKIDLLSEFLKSVVLIYTNENGYRANKMEVVYYDLISQRIILGVLHGKGLVDINRKFISLTVKQVYTWDTISELDDKYSSVLEFKDILATKDTNAYIDYLVLSDEEIESVYNNNRNYDINNSSLYRLVKRIGTDTNNSSLRVIPIEKLLKVFQDTEFFVEKQFTLNKLNNSKAYALIDKIVRGNCEILVYEDMEGRGKRDKMPDYVDSKHICRYGYLYYIKTPKTVDTRKQKCYYSDIDVEVILNILSQLEVGVIDNALNRIDNRLVNRGQFIELNKVGIQIYDSGRTVTDYVDYVIGVDKYNGDAYFLIGVNGGYIPFLRFKSLVDLIHWDLSLRLIGNTYVEYLGNIVINILKGVGDISTIKVTRDLIIDGIPNNLPIIDTGIDRVLISSLAKQPK